MAVHKQYCVYMLKTARGALYVGQTCDLARRLGEHGSGRGSKYIRANGPFTLAYTEPAESLSQALKREAELKRLTHAQKLVLVSSWRV